MHELFTVCTELVRSPYTEHAASGLPNPTHVCVCVCVCGSCILFKLTLSGKTSPGRGRFLLGFNRVISLACFLIMPTCFKYHLDYACSSWYAGKTLKKNNSDISK